MNTILEEYNKLKSELGPNDNSDGLHMFVAGCLFILDEIAKGRGYLDKKTVGTALNEISSLLCGPRSDLQIDPKELF